LLDSLVLAPPWGVHSQWKVKNLIFQFIVLATLDYNVQLFYRLSDR
jgi:hypothetical protein